MKKKNSVWKIFLSYLTRMWREVRSIFLVSFKSIAWKLGVFFKYHLLEKLNSDDGAMGIPDEFRTRIAQPVVVTSLWNLSRWWTDMLSTIVPIFKSIPWKLSFFCSYLLKMSPLLRKCRPCFESICIFVRTGAIALKFGMRLANDVFSSYAKFGVDSFTTTDMAENRVRQDTSK